MPYRIIIAFCFLGGLSVADDNKSRTTESPAGEVQYVENPQSIFLIGNSLTWDTRPQLLEGDVKWHIDCGKSLAFIRKNPEKPCVATSTRWPTAFAGNQFDFICVQPHYGTTLEEDVAVICDWVRQQQKAVFIIHTGWAKHELFETERSHDNVDGLLTHSDIYFNALLTQLRQTFPAREFRCTRAMNLLFRIADDIESGQSPLEKLSDLYRDAIHMRTDSGRLLMHNAMRSSLGQPVSTAGFPETDPAISGYLLKTLAEFSSATASDTSNTR